ncbi:hypothetical protein [Ruegeria sp. HU-ET01832]|uniref:hypothetical protein n=1 Tax=Ruegeria sp. HU-ET01832 TaxID=3135906 RepID=UPI003341699B
MLPPMNSWISNLHSFEDVSDGFIGATKLPITCDAAGNVVWVLQSYAFLEIC